MNATYAIGKKPEVLKSLISFKDYLDMNVLHKSQIGFLPAKSNIRLACPNLTNDCGQVRAWLASHTSVLKGARFSSLPTNACSTEDSSPFPLFYLRGK